MDLADRFTEILHMNWSEFVKIEHDENATSDDAMICGLIRAYADGGWMPINMEHYLDGNFELIDTIEEDITGKTLGVWEILDEFSRSIY